MTGASVPRSRILAAFTLLLLSALIAALALSGEARVIDIALLLRLSRYPSPAWLWITFFGEGGTRTAVAAIACAGLIIVRRWRDALWLAATGVTGLLLVTLAKNVLERPRPALLPHLQAVSSWSMPSGHAANGLILYGALALLAPDRFRTPAIVLAMIAAAAIGTSRVALAVHWPSDVAAGWCFGAGWLALACAFRHGSERPGRGSAPHAHET